MSEEVGLTIVATTQNNAVATENKPDREGETLSRLTDALNTYEGIVWFLFFQLCGALIGFICFLFIESFVETAGEVHWQILIAVTTWAMAVLFMRSILELFRLRHSQLRHQSETASEEDKPRFEARYHSWSEHLNRFERVWGFIFSQLTGILFGFLTFLFISNVIERVESKLYQILFAAGVWLMFIGFLFSTLMLIQMYHERKIRNLGYTKVTEEGKSAGMNSEVFWVDKNKKKRSTKRPNSSVDVIGRIASLNRVMRYMYR